MIEKTSTPIRVLLIEDSPHDQAAVRRALARSRMDFILTVRERVEELPAALDEDGAGHDIVVVDYDLPGINGLEGFQRLPGKTDLPPFVMLTGAGSEALAVSAMKAGMADYLIKDPNQGYLRLLPLKLRAVQRQHMEHLARVRAQDDLKRAYAGLEQVVQERTADLNRTVQSLKEEILHRQATEKALRDSEEALRRLSLKVTDAQESERRQIAKELHDSIGSSLAAIKFAMEAKLAGMVDARRQESLISLEEIIDNTRSTIEELRRITAHLRPARLDEEGLLATMDWFCRTNASVYRETRIHTRFDLAEHAIPEALKIVIFRVMQEAVNNALRHSQCDTLTVRLEGSGGLLRLQVIDNGCGFDVERVMAAKGAMGGSGLRGMMDRAELMGGGIRLASRIGEGTRLFLELPLGGG